MNEMIQRELRAAIEAFANEVTEILTRAVAGSVATALGTGSAGTARKAVPLPEATQAA